MNNDILEFQGEFRWLSNFFPVDIEYEEHIFPSIENAYQAGKCLLESDKEKFVNITPGQAKRLIKKLPTKQFKNNTDFDLFRLELMHKLLKQKFSKEPFKTLLLKTENCYIAEGTYWINPFWGKQLSTCEGKNHLGNLIMEIRKELQN